MKTCSKKRIVALSMAVLMLFCVFSVAPVAKAAYISDDYTVSEPNTSLTDVEENVAYSTGNNKFYSTLEQALDEATFLDTVYLLKNYILSGPVAVKNYATLILPTSDDYTKDDLDGNNISGPKDKKSAHVLLTVPEGTTLTIDSGSTLIVAGNQQSTVPDSGYLTGYYGAIDLEGNLVVNGTLYARGEIDGGGHAYVNSTGTVYQRFEIADWRGGNASLSAYSNEAHSVYPFNLYSAAGLNVTTTYYSGSHSYGQAFIYSNQLGDGTVSLVGLIGDEGALIKFDNDSTNVEFTHVGDVSTATVNGSVTTGNISVDIKFYGIEFSLTATGVGPFGYNQNIVLSENSTFNVSNELKILPGSTITVKSGATLNASGRLYLYTANKYSSTYNNAGWTSTSDAVVEVEDGGNITGNIGSTSTTFGNVHGATITANAPDEDVWEVTQSGTSVQFHNIPFTMHLTPAPTPAE